MVEVQLLHPFLETLKKSQIFISLNKKDNIKLVSGGESRKDSVINGLKSVKEANDIVCIHDAARPFIKTSYIKHSIDACSEFDGAIIAIPAVDTVKKADNQLVKNTIDRESLWMAQTPKSTLMMMVSAFADIDLLKKAYREAKKNDYRFLSYGDAMIII